MIENSSLAKRENKSNLLVALVIAIMLVVSTHMFSNPPDVKAADPTPSTIGLDGSDFTTQAALTGVSARQTNNIVGVQSYYDVVFTTTTTGTIKFIDIAFPAGTVIGASPLLVEREGIGTGTAAKTSATVIRYTVDNAVSVPAGTQIRLEFFNVVNPNVPSGGYKVTVTTLDAGGTTIDGPTLSNSLNMKQIGTDQIADSAVTSGKIADGNVGTTDLANLAVSSGKLANNAVTTFKVSTGFMKHVTLADDAVGNGRGWNPNGATTAFNIDDPDIDNANFDFVILELNDVGAATTNAICGVTDISINGDFDMDCNIAPANGIELHYILATVQADT